MRYLKVLILLLIFLASMMFFIQNTQLLEQRMSLQFSVFTQTWRSIPLPFYLLMLIAFGAGSLLTIFAFLSERIRLGSEVKSCRAKNASLEKELNSLRNLPLDSESYPSSGSSGSSASSSSSTGSSYSSSFGSSESSESKKDKGDEDKKTS